MKIPKKISPDRIKDAIVEIRYSTSLHFELVPGIFFNCLDDSYTYTNRPIGKIPGQTNLHRPVGIKHSEANLHLTVPGLPPELFLGGQSIFYNEKIKIQILPNSLIFNIINEYISWENYRTEIEKALSQLIHSNVFEKFFRIGIRYISEYPNHDLHSCVRFDFSFGMPSIKSDKYLFQSEFNVDQLRVILNLKHKQPTLNAKDISQPTTTSVIDLDLISDNLDFSDITSLLGQIDMVHSKEKEIFFNLLKEDFLKTLNPVY